MSAPAAISAVRSTMSCSLRVLSRGVRYAAVVATALGSIATASAAEFTFNPFAVGLGVAGNAFTADTLTLGDFSTVRFTGPTTGGIGFTQTGFLPIFGASNGLNPVSTNGLNTNYSLYFAFSGTGVQNSANVTGAATSGSYSALTINLIGANGPTTFAFDSSNNPIVASSNPTTVLATGGLLGPLNFVATQPAPGTAAGFLPSAGARTSINPTSAGLPFFQAPVPFYSSEQSTFINLPNQVAAIRDSSGAVTGFSLLANGGGTSNFEPRAVPEPASMLLLGAGLVAVGLVRRRG